MVDLRRETKYRGKNTKLNILRPGTFSSSHMRVSLSGEKIRTRSPTIHLETGLKTVSFTHVYFRHEKT